jgi:hypothetical protein
MRGLTQRQEECLDLICGWITEHGYPPTLRELGAKMGIKSTNGVHDHLAALARKGFISIGDGLARGISLAGRAEEAPVARPVPNADPYVGPWTINSASHANLGASERLFVTHNALVYQSTPNNGRALVRLELPIDVVRHLVLRGGDRQ